MTPSKHSSSKPPIHAALYARISTLNHGQDPEVRLGEVREFCQRRGFTIAHEYVVPSTRHRVHFGHGSEGAGSSLPKTLLQPAP